jgi:hypothetical protein
MSAPAQAHVSISPLIGVSSTGTIVRDSVTIGKSGYLFFRLGHGCAYGATTDVNPLTGLSLEGTSWGTHAFSVTIPYAAAVNASTGALKAPKPGYRPGWVSKVVLYINSKGSAVANNDCPVNQWWNISKIICCWSRWLWIDY